ncbi:MAG TPA: elongation factor P [Candidatus Dormibacteraeota bacterium]|nr:elongation factor P [Candidatus Dormibacteraeota bacterium]
MIETNDFRVGSVFEMDGKLLSIVSVEHIKLARAGAIIKAKLRNVRDGSIFEHSFRSGEKFKAVRIEKSEATYLYGEGNFHHFMDSTTYDQIALDRSQVADVLPFLKEGNPVSVLRYEDSVIGVELPVTVDLAVAATEPGVRGDTVSGATKPARLETGATAQVPLFINAGDRIRVDTRTGNYVERVSG